MTFNSFINNLDVMMLSYFGVSPELIGFYGMGAQIVINLRQVRLVFSGAYAPSSRASGPSAIAKR